MNRAGPPATPPAPILVAAATAEQPDVTLYTDGACSGNPGPGGWGYVIVWNGRELEGSGGDPKTTNNRMELTAAIEGLKALKRPCAVHIHTDSQYVLKGMTEWIAGWRRKGWKNAQGKPVENREYWEALAEQVARHQVKWTWVKGHAGHAYNERVDKLAVAAVPKPKRT